MTISKFCFSKFFALCCLCFVFTISLPTKANAVVCGDNSSHLDGWIYGGGDPLETQCYNSGGSCYDPDRTPYQCFTDFGNCAMPSGPVHPTLGVTVNDIIAAEEAAAGVSPGDFGGAFVLLNDGDDSLVVTCQGNALIASFFGTYGPVEHSSMGICQGAIPSCTLGGGPPPLPVIGTCGTANGGTFASAPTTNLCNFGNGVATPAPSGSGPWTWTCGGLYGGASSGNCTATQSGGCTWNCIGRSGVGPVGTLYYFDCTNGSVAITGISASPFMNPQTITTWLQTSPAPTGPYGGSGPNTYTCSGDWASGYCCSNSVNGTCGTSNGGTFASAPTTNLCGNGNGVATPAPSGSGPWTWTCGGSGGGSSSGNCTATQTAPPGCNLGCEGSVIYHPCKNTGCATTDLTCPSGTRLHITGASTWSGPGACNGNLISWAGALSSYCITDSACNAPAVNGTCGTSNGGTFASAPTTNLCGNGNGVATPAPSGSGPWTWTCGGSGGGSASGNCTASQTASPVNGFCSGTAGACTAGTVAGDNGLVACGTTRTWDCNGSGGGTNDSCTYNNSVCLVNGSCGAANGVGVYSAPSSGLCGTGSATAVSGSGPFTWSCNGAGGGTNAACSAPLAQNGACGASHGGNFYVAPAAGLCSVGTASAVGGTGPWTWTCTGVSGGTTANCSANLSVNGSCGAANGVGATSAPSSGLCGAGSATAVAGTGPWTWSCNGSNGGTNAACSAPVQVNGTCGAADGVGAYSAPSSGLCGTGSATAVAGSGPFTWSCNGTNGGSNAACSAPLRTDGVCGASHNGNFYTAPATGLCSAGSVSAVGGSGPWTWTCAGTNGGLTAACNANPSIDGVCGTANGVSTATAPTNPDLCSAGNDTAVTNSSNTWNWGCNGVNGGTNATCSAPERINGTCGPANGSSVYTAPSSGLCATGNSTSVTGSGPFDWNCNGVNGGTNASCSASLTVNGQCGPAHGAFSATTPSSGLCSAGSAGAVAGTGPFTWTCSGLNGGTAVGCSSQIVVQGTCGPSNNVPTSTAPAAGLCATGTATAITGTGPWAWSCTGTGGGITSTCTAPTPPPPPSFGGACPA